MSADNRPEDVVPCPACGKGPSDSCDGPSSHPSRLGAYEAFRPKRVMLPASTAADWVIGDIKVENRCGLCGDSFGVRAKHVCSKAAIDSAKGVMLTSVEPPQSDVDVSIHFPRIARTLLEGPGNKTLVRGCACGAAVMSAETYAEHVGWPIEAVRAMLGLIGIADDLIGYSNELKRKDVWQQINRCLEVRR